MFIFITYFSKKVLTIFTNVFFIIGLSAKKLNIQDGDFGFGKGILFGIVNIFAHAAAWRFVAPILDILIYAEPANKVSVWAFL